MSPTRVAQARRRLHEEQTATVERIESLLREHEGLVEATRDVASDDEHDPEGTTLAYEREQAMSLLEQARAHLAAVEKALQRVEDGSYGTCARCGQPIAPGRLAARPTAETCTACATAASLR